MELAVRQDRLDLAAGDVHLQSRAFEAEAHPDQWDNDMAWSLLAVAAVYSSAGHPQASSCFDRKGQTRFFAELAAVRILRHIRSHLAPVQELGRVSYQDNFEEAAVLVQGLYLGQGRVLHNLLELSDYPSWVCRVADGHLYPWKTFRC
jgi:hypothetical protein